LLRFPGQGSQQAGMGKRFGRTTSGGRQVFEEADTALGFALSELCFNGREISAVDEKYAAAILTVRLPALRALENEGLPNLTLCRP